MLTLASPNQVHIQTLNGFSPGEGLHSCSHKGRWQRGVLCLELEAGKGTALYKEGERWSWDMWTWDWGCSQVTGHLPSVCKALGSIPSMGALGVTRQLENISLEICVPWMPDDLHSTGSGWDQKRVCWRLDANVMFRDSPLGSLGF